MCGRWWMCDLKNIYLIIFAYLYLKITSHNFADNLWITVYISNGSLILITYNRLVVFNLFSHSINNSRSLVFSLGAAVLNSWDRGVYGTCYAAAGIYRGLWNMLYAAAGIEAFVTEY